MSSGAFDGEELSVDQVSIVTAKYGGHGFTRDGGNGGVGVAEFAAGLARSLGQEVLADPLKATAEHEENEAHTLVKGKKSKRTKKAFVDGSRFIP